MTTRLTADRIVAAVLLAVMVTWLVLSLQLELFVEGRPGPGFFPIWLSALGSVITAWILISEFLPNRNHHNEQEAAGQGTLSEAMPMAMNATAPVAASNATDTAATTTPTVIEGAVVDPTREGIAVVQHDRGELWRPVGAFAGLFAFFFLQPVLGFQVGLLLLLLFISFVLIKMPWRVALTVCIGTSLFIYGIFDVLFDVPFATGIFGI